MTTITMIPAKDLRIDDKANVRKVGRGADTEFTQSIAAHGVIQPLLVRPNGKGYLVTDGGKRLAAVQALIAGGHLQPSAEVPCIVKKESDQEAREHSLTLNVIRANMHPVDELRAFQTLHTDKTMPLHVDAIALRFGMKRRHVIQTLALGALDDSVLDAWRDGKIGAEAARVFTLCTDKKRQAKVMAQLLKEGGEIGAWAVRRALEIKSAGNLLNTVKAEDYERRGGKITVDLFGDNHAVSDPELLQLMAHEAIEATCVGLLEQGWSFAEPRKSVQNYWEYGTLDVKAKPTPDEKTRMDALLKAIEAAEDRDTNADDQLAEYERIEAEVKARAYTDKHRKASGCFVSIDNNGYLVIDAGKTKPRPRVEQTASKTAAGGAKDKTKAKGPATITKALAERLTVQRQRAIKAAIVADKHPTPLAHLLAHATAELIRADSVWNAMPDAIKKRLDQIATAITPKVLNAALRKEFDAKDYFAAAPKPILLAAITEVLNKDEARKVANSKRAEIAKFALTNIGKTGWLPKELRAAKYDGPGKRK